MKHELKLKSMNENFGPITLKIKKTCNKEFKLISFSRTPVGDFLCDDVIHQTLKYGDFFSFCIVLDKILLFSTRI